MIVYKNNYEESEKLFSTGNEELDDILEEVYYSGIEDGYDYAQKEFSKYEQIGRTLVNETKFRTGPQRWTNFGGRLPNRVNSLWYEGRAGAAAASKKGTTLSQQKRIRKELLGMDPYESTTLQIKKALKANGKN